MVIPSCLQVAIKLLTSRLFSYYYIKHDNIIMLNIIDDAESITSSISDQVFAKRNQGLIPPWSVRRLNQFTGLSKPKCVVEKLKEKKKAPILDLVASFYPPVKIRVPLSNFWDPIPVLYGAIILMVWIWWSVSEGFGIIPTSMIFRMMIEAEESEESSLSKG